MGRQQATRRAIGALSTKMGRAFYDSATGTLPEELFAMPCTAKLPIAANGAIACSI